VLEAVRKLPGSGGRRSVAATSPSGAHGAAPSTGLNGGFSTTSTVLGMRQRPVGRFLFHPSDSCFRPALAAAFIHGPHRRPSCRSVRR
jgi:hypothetical protein